MVVFWGDSIFAGPERAGYISIFLSRLLDDTIVPIAFAGASSSATLRCMRKNEQLLDGVALISAGRCNYEEPEQVKADYEAMLELLFHGRLLVFPLIQTLRRGTECHARIEELNEWLRGLVGDRFIDVHGFLQREGLALAGLIPTRRDLRDITGGVVPASLRCDGIHPNAIANRLIAGVIANEIAVRGWARCRPNPIWGTVFPSSVSVSEFPL